MQLTDNDIKILRLQSGEDIIASHYVDKDTNLIYVDKPMHVIFKRMPNGKTIMMMIPWLPVELITENNAIIDYDSVLTVLQPREELISYYIKASLIAHSLIGDEDIGKSLIEDQEEMFDEEYLDGEEDFDEEELSTEDLEEIIKDRKKHQLH
jgi:hypothetical protein